MVTEINAAFCGTKFFTVRSMKRLVQYFFNSSKEESGIFPVIRGIVVFLLVLTFQGAIVYIMISS